MTTSTLENQKAAVGDDYLAFSGSEKKTFETVLKHIEVATSMEESLKSNLKMSEEELLTCLKKIWVNFETASDQFRELIRYATDTKKKEFLTNQYNIHQSHYHNLRKDMQRYLKMKKAMVASYNESNDKTVNGSTDTNISKEQKKEQSNNLIFQNLINKLTYYEYENQHEQKQGNKKASLKYFKGLLEHYKNIFFYMKGIFVQGMTSNECQFQMSDKLKINWDILKLVLQNDKDKGNLILTFLGQVEGIFDQYKKKTETRLDNIGGNEQNMFNSKSGHSQNEIILSFSAFIENLKQFCKSQIFEGVKNGLMGDIDQLFNSKSDGFINTIESSMRKIIKDKKLQYSEFEDNGLLKNFYYLILQSLQVLNYMESDIDVLSNNQFEVTFFFLFLKKFVIQLFISEIFKRLVTYSKFKKNLYSD